MFTRKKADVLVVGAGPVGMFGALVLARRGIRVRIVDEAWRTGAHSYGLALHAQSLALLEEMGLAEEVLKQARRVQRIGVYDDAGRCGSLDLESVRSDFPEVAVVRQDVLEDMLERALEDAGVKVDWDHYVADLTPGTNGVTATVHRLEQASFGYAIAHSETIIANVRKMDVGFVLGADGSQSLVRTAMGLHSTQAAPPQYFAVFEFKTDADLEGEMRLMFGSETTNVAWPLPDGHCRFSFEITPALREVGPREKDRNESEDGRIEYAILTEDHLRSFLAERAPWFNGSIDEIRWRTVVRFDRRLAERFGEDRIWLAGDAAHLTGPAGIQSMNVGLQEAHDLANLMADNLQDKATLADLERYERRDHERWRFLLGLEGGIAAGPDADDWVRLYGERLISCLPAAGSDLDALMRQLNAPAVNSY